jgi:Cu-Zn family superoxide dismutase
MTKLSLAVAAAVAIATAAAGVRAAEPVGATVIGGDGQAIGAASFTDTPHGVLIHVRIEPGGLSPGAHGMHLHSVADCSDVGTFKRSKGHINVARKAHGLLNPKGPDNADLPNLIAASDGSAEAELFTTRVRLSEGAARLLDSDGSALVIHANPDDHASQPIGGAGPRVACAPISG